jgi:ligand-binding sensor domain-containing protein
MSKYLIAFLLLFVLNQAQSQKQIAQHYTMANGLPSNEAFSVLKDKNGYTWIATDGGVCQFDGNNFTTYTTKEGLGENTILEIKEDKQGRIWCRGYSGTFTIIDKDSLYTLNIKPELVRNKINSSLYQFELDDSLNLYLATRTDGIIYKASYPYKKINQISLPNNSISFFQINAQKTITSYSMNLDGKTEMDKVVITLQKKSSIVPIKIATARSNIFLRYIYTPTSVLISLDEKIATISFATNKVSIQNIPFRISAMTKAADTTVLIGGFNGEVGLLNTVTNTFTMIDNYPSAISNIYFEHNKCWLTTLKNGIYYISNTNYTVLHENKEPLISMLPIAKDSLYILNSNSQASLITTNKETKLPNTNTQNILMYWQQFDNSQNKYVPLIGCYNYLIDRATNKKINFDLNKKVKWVQTEFLTPVNNNLYASFYGGIREYDIATQQLKNYISAKVRITCLYGNEGILYLGSLQGAYKLINNEVVPLDTHAYFKHRIESIDKLDKNNLVIATQAQGIGIYNLTTKKLTEYNKNINLDKLIIQHAHVDAEGKIWLATYRSIHVLKLGSNNVAELLDVVDLELYDQMIKEVRVLNNQVYILAGNLILKIGEKKINYNTQAFKMTLNALNINDKKINFQEGKLVNLPPNKNNLLFKYQLLSYTKNHQTEYRYRLNNDDWIYTTNNELQLASLPSGSYTLNIDGRLKNGPWSKSIMIKFDIQNPFYKTWWFITLAILGSLLLTYILASWYLKTKFKKRLKEFELQRELESARLMASKSQMNPHFIFNALNSIQSFVLKSEKMQAYQYLNDFSSLIRTYLEYSNKDYIKLDKELELIQSYIKIEQLRIPFQFEIEIVNNILPNEDYIFSLLLQPCLENAIWHGLNHKTGEKKLLLSISKKNNAIEITITDNGIGRKQSAIINANRISKPNSVATNNMNSRISSLNLLYRNQLQLKIIDNVDIEGLSTGTTVLISHDAINDKIKPL